MLEDLKNSEIQGIAAYDVKRLTRDEFGIDGGTIARRIVEAGGRFITWESSTHAEAREWFDDAS